jgi:hypothetical protein
MYVNILSIVLFPNNMSKTTVKTKKKNTEPDKSGRHSFILQYMLNKVKHKMIILIHLLSLAITSCFKFNTNTCLAK